LTDEKGPPGLPPESQASSAGPAVPENQASAAGGPQSAPAPASPLELGEAAPVMPAPAPADNPSATRAETPEAPVDAPTAEAAGGPGPADQPAPIDAMTLEYLSHSPASPPPVITETDKPK
jgi:hypothetical protein